MTKSWIFSTPLKTQYLWRRKSCRALLGHFRKARLAAIIVRYITVLWSLSRLLLFQRAIDCQNTTTFDELMTHLDVTFFSNSRHSFIIRLKKIYLRINACGVWRVISNSPSPCIFIFIVAAARPLNYVVRSTYYQYLLSNYVNRLRTQSKFKSINAKQKSK